MRFKMAKKANEPKRQAFIYNPNFTGFINEMPQDAKDKMLTENPELHKRLFGEKSSEK